ncbi:MAG TPA: potassium-transporting ATPase subunit KdpA [Candidatus Acidoferrales bacterium]|nr:potassium-transporting ATPase subunit KdpA [Candidatus Acidoferrales bacterium]
MTFQIWFLPFLLLATATLVAFPLSRYMAWIMEGNYRPPRIFVWFEKRLDSGHQNWKQYLVALLVFNTALGIFGFLVLALQEYLPLNPLHRPMVAPSTIFNSVISFMTNTNLQHYSGDQHFSNFSQIFFDISNMFMSAAIGLCALTAIIRALRSDSHLGNFFLDMCGAC